MRTATALVENETFHVSAVRAFHQEVRAAETSAAIAAWHAGNHARKLQEQFGWSLRKIAEETGVPLKTTHRYLCVCRRRHSATDIRFGESISSIIEEDVPSVREKKARAATFSNTEAEYAIKLVRMAESNSEHEAAIASRKLEQFAADHGMSKDELVSKSCKTLGLTEDLQNPDDLKGPLEKATERLMEPYRRMSKERVLEVLLTAIMLHPELIRELDERFMGHAGSQRVSAMAD